MALGSVSFGQGMASGIDYQAIIDAIAKADAVPINTLQKRVDSYNNAKYAFNDLSRALMTFEEKLTALKSGSAIGGKTTTLSGAPAGTSAPFSASAGSDALSGTYSIKVQNLAQAHRVRSAGVLDAYSQTVADGQIRIKSGTNDEIVVDVSAANGNNSLSAIAAAINNADQGVAASVVNDGTNALLVVRATTAGAASQLTISDGTNLGLGDPANVLQAAENAQIDVDGIQITAQTNKISTAIPGVTLDLTAELPDTAITLTVADDVAGTKKAIQDFVDAYNKVNELFESQLGSADALKNSAVGGSSVYRNIQLQLQGMLTASVEGIPGGKINTLAELGITIADGTGAVKFDASNFDDLVDAGRYDEVRAVLQSSGSTTDASVGYISSSPNTKAGNYAIQITQAAQQASVTGSTAIAAGGLSVNETLTFEVDGATRTVDLLAGDTLDTIVTKINTTLGAAGFGARAEASEGRLLLRSVEFGSAYQLTVTSSVADAADGNSTGIGTTGLTDTGVDVAGTINGAAATGHGRDLVADAGSDAEGLIVRIYATDALVASKGGNFGTIGFSQGLASQFTDILDGITDPLEGTIKSAHESYDASIKLAKEKIESIQRRIESKTEMLTRQFSAAEQAISQLNQMMASLNS